MKKQLKSTVKLALDQVGLLLVRSESVAQDFGLAIPPLPKGAKAYLSSSNPRLREIQDRYRALNIPATAHSVWNAKYLEEELDIANFRADNAYVWQERGINLELSYLLTACYVRSIDSMGLWNIFKEDGLFGALCCEYEDGVKISRDFLDSISEIDFLEQNIGISKKKAFCVLDIGAGYGRLASRLLAAYPNLRNVLCTDAVAESSFISEYYLRYRGLEDRAKTVLLDEIQDSVKEHKPDLVVNILSFSETTYAAICWWLDLIAEHEIEYFFIVPNAAGYEGRKFLSRELDETRIDFRDAITSRGYKLVVEEPKFLDPCVQARGLFPSRQYLFKRE